MALLPTFRMATDIYKSTPSPGFLLDHTTGMSTSLILLSMVQKADK
jgi:hypothetical protein